VAKFGTFGSTVIEPILLRVGQIDTHRPPHFDDINFSYYNARTTCYLEVVDLGVWRVTQLDKPPRPLRTTRNLLRVKKKKFILMLVLKLLA
jgi:hypothetical protein